MFTTYFRDKILNTGRGTALAAWTPYVGLITAITNFRAGTVTEASYTGYGTRPSATLAAPADTAPIGGRFVSNSGSVTFPQNTGTSQDMIGFGWWDAATAGNLVGIGFLDADSPLVGMVVDTTADQIVAPSHGLVVDQRVYLLAAPGLPLPTGVSENTAYYVGTVPDANHITLSTTTGNGTPVNITALGGALLIPYTPVTVALNATPQFAAASLVMEL